MNTLVSTMLSIAVLAAFVLAGGGLWLIFKHRNRKQGLLMLLAAAVLFVNVLIWTLPPPG